MQHSDATCSRRPPRPGATARSSSPWSRPSCGRRSTPPGRSATPRTAAGTSCAGRGPSRSTPTRATRPAAGRSPATARCSRSAASWCPPAGASVVALVLLNGLAAAAGLVVPRLLGELVNTTVGGGGPSLDTLALAVVGGRGAAGRPDLRRAAHVDPVRPGPAVQRARVRRPHDPAAAAGVGREREHRRPGHPRDPRRRHDEPGGAVRAADGDHLGAHRGAVDRRDAAELRGCSRCRRWWCSRPPRRRCARTCGGRRRRTSPRAGPTRGSTPRSPRPSRARGRWSRSACPAAGSGRATTTSRCRRRPSGTG